LVRSSEISSPRSQLPLLRFVALQSVMSNEAAGSLGSLLPPQPHCFQWALRSNFTAGPVPLRVRVHPLVRFSPLQSPCRSKPTRHRSAEQPPVRFCSQSRLQCEKSTFRKPPKPASFHPQRFARSRRVPPPHTLWAYFIPLPRPGFTFQGFSSLPSRPASSACRTLLPLRASCLPPSFPGGSNS